MLIDEESQPRLAPPDAWAGRYGPDGIRAVLNRGAGGNRAYSVSGWSGNPEAFKQGEALIQESPGLTREVFEVLGLGLQDRSVDNRSMADRLELSKCVLCERSSPVLPCFNGADEELLEPADLDACACDG